MAQFIYWNWEEVDLNWENTNLNWEEVGFLIDEVVPSMGGLPIPGQRIPQWYDLKPLNDKLDDDKKRKLIKIICKLEGKEYEESKYKNDKDITITIKHIEVLVEKLNKIKVHVQNIH